MDSQCLRQAFTQYFADRGHAVVPSASLIPHNDPTLLFTNAGMVPFKDVFLGIEQRDYTRATSIQRCVRAGGKHNDLDNVGYTARHHTFFEMMGNFSFGDYFKEDAIRFAWEFLTQVVKLPKEKLWVTVFEEDDEAADIWLKTMGVDSTRFSRIGAKDNFWSMGDTGPCGPCTEIFYDHGPEIAGGPPGTPEEDGDRYIEIWNLVFMQYNRQKDGTMTPLPNPAVDTGMGLERLAAILQGVHDNYDIDIFQHLIKATAQLGNIKDLTQQSLRVIADHIRATAFLIIDGVIPGNEGRGYVLRRIMRRALRHGDKLGIEGSFFNHLVEPLVEIMGEAYPELIKEQARIEQIIAREEVQFARTLSQGMRIFNEGVNKLTDKTIPGDMAFTLYDTYGFPVDLTADMARERSMIVDMTGFDRCMQEQRARARAAGQFQVDYNDIASVDHHSEFTGYDALTGQGKLLTVLNQNGQPIDSLSVQQQGMLVVDQTPFYAESGGQVGDEGRIACGDAVFIVKDTQKQGDATLHCGKVIQGEFTLGETLSLMVDAEKRQASACNHSATHLLHAALRQILGGHVVQKGSLVTPERLRFDFSHTEGLSADDIKQIELLVNAQVRANHVVETVVTDVESAKEMGAIALFGEKYGDTVRVLKMGDFSVEFCGGTHVSSTGDIGAFVIVQDSAVAAGVRRIEAITASEALSYLQEQRQQLTTLGQKLKTNPAQLGAKLDQALQDLKQAQKQVNQLQAELAGAAQGQLSDQAIDVGGVKVLAVEVRDVAPKALRDMLDQLKVSLGSAVIALGIAGEGKVSLITGVTDDLTGQYNAGNLVRFLAEQVGGKGGGRADMAQAGGDQPEKLADVLATVEDWVRKNR